MSNAIDEVKKLEDEMIQAELKPDPDYFSRVLDDDALIAGKKIKAFVVEHHQSGVAQKFTRVEMSDYNYINHGAAVVVTCKGQYDGPAGSTSLKFMRVWLKKPDGWKIITGTVEGGN
jgi:hypothetical protein